MKNCTVKDEAKNKVVYEFYSDISNPIKINQPK